MSEELKPCAHCGSKGAEVVFDTVVLCSGCTAEAQPSDWNRRVVTPAQVEAAAKALGVELELSHPEEREYLRNIATVVLRAAGLEVQS